MTEAKPLTCHSISTWCKTKPIFEIRSADMTFPSNILVHSAHPLVLSNIQRILTATPYTIHPFNHNIVQLMKLRNSMTIIDACSINEWLEITLQLYERPNVILFDKLPSLEEQLRFLYLGICGIVTMVNLEHQLMGAIDSVMKGHLWFSRNVLEEHVKRTKSIQGQGASIFTLREEQVMAFLLKGASNKEIGNSLCISDRTVKFHVSNILRKCKVENRRSLRKATSGKAITGGKAALGI